jgi:hypothetical protein
MEKLNVRFDVKTVESKAKALAIGTTLNKSEILRAAMNMGLDTLGELHHGAIAANVGYYNNLGDEVK